MAVPLHLIYYNYSYGVLPVASIIYARVGAWFEAMLLLVL